VRIIVCGSRGWTDRVRVFRVLDGLLPDPADWADVQPTIVHGACSSGADKFASDFARERHIGEHPNPADWNNEGKAAGMIRNALMASAGADVYIAFWDGKSPGTRHMIECATKCGIPVRIVPQAPRADRQGER